MQLTIELTKPFTEAVGKDEIILQFEGSTVHDLMRKLTELYPGLQSMFYSETGSITEYMIVFVNSKPLSALNGMETELSDDDRLYILFPISGG